MTVKILNRVGHMKLIVGEPGKPDGHIPPERITSELYDHSCKDALREENCKRDKVYKIDGLEINLFNITGNVYQFSDICQ